MNDDIRVTCPSLPDKEEYFKEIEELWENKWITNNGKKCKQLEANLKKFLSVNNLSLFCNGHMALEMTIKAFGLTGEVITTPFTFVSTTHAIVRNGLTPVFCDINPIDYTMDVTKIEKLITPRTTAIIPVHVYGNVCNIEKIDEIAKKYKLKVIYDAAHAFGVNYKGKSVASYGDASMFSFHATKVFHTIEGGAVVFQNDSIDEKLAGLKNFGIRGPEVVDMIGTNAKMNEFQAAMGICNLRHFNEERAKRKRLVEKYMERLANMSGIKICSRNQFVDSNYGYFPVEIDEKLFGISRNELHNYMQNNGVMCRKYFYPLVTEFECYNTDYASKKTPIALQISNQIMTLPLYSTLEEESVEYVCDMIANCRK